MYRPSAGSGRLSLKLQPSPGSAAGLTGTNIMAGPVREVVAPLAEQAAAGTLKVDVTTVLPLNQAVEGLATIAGGRARGKIVVKIAD